MDRSGSSETYVAGHWRSHFPYDLLWHLAFPQKMTNDKSPTRRHPTWSWTSVDVRVKTPYEHYNTAYSAVELVVSAVVLRNVFASFGDVDFAPLTIKSCMITAECRVTVTYWPPKIWLHFQQTGKDFGKARLGAMGASKDSDYVLDVVFLLTETSVEESTYGEAAGLIVYKELGGNGRKRLFKSGCWDATGYFERKDEKEGRQRMEVVRVFE